MAFAVVLSACSDNGLQELALIESGSLHVSLVDSEDQPLAGVTVDLYDLAGGLLYERLLTDNNGAADFGIFNSGNYLLRFKSGSNMPYFQFPKIVQIVSGHDKKVQVNLKDYMVSADISVHDYQSEELVPVEGLFVSFVPATEVPNVNNQSLLAEAIETYGITAEVSLGKAKVEHIPVGQYFVFLHSATYIFDGNLTVGLSQYDERSLTFYVNGLSLLLQSKSVYDVVSLKNLYNSESLNHPYSTVAFNGNLMTITLTDGSSVEANYYINVYGSNPPTYYLDFNWPISNYWGNAIVQISGSDILLTLFDSQLSDDVLITLR